MSRARQTIRWRDKVLSMKTRWPTRSLQKKQTCQPHNKNGAAWGWGLGGFMSHENEVETLLILLNITVKSKVIETKKNAF